MALRHLLRREPLPLPPEQLRNLIGGAPPEDFDNPSRGLVYPYLQRGAYQAVLDLGCGCGRVARQLIQQRPRPSRYLGLDLHRGMVEWCELNLAPCAKGFRFEHHDVRNVGLNPDGSSRVLPLPVGDGEFSLFNAISVFTHMAEDQAVHYLREAVRVLRPDGYMHASWFLFDKADFPMMQTFQNALFINETDPSNAVIFDRRWLQETAAEVGLTITRAQPPEVKGFHWYIVMRPYPAGEPEVQLPADNAPRGRRPPPLLPRDAANL